MNDYQLHLALAIHRAEAAGYPHFAAALAALLRNNLQQP